MNRVIGWIYVGLISLAFYPEKLEAQVWGIYTTSGFHDGWVEADNQWYPPVGPPCLLQPFPSATFDSFFENVFSPGVKGHQLGLIPRTGEVNEGTPAAGVGSCENPLSTIADAIAHAHAYVDGLNTSAVTISYKIGPGVYGNPEVEYHARAINNLNITIQLDVTGAPNGFPLQIHWSWGHFGGLGSHNGSESGNEDWSLTTAQLFVNGVEQFNGAFNFNDVEGWNVQSNQTGVINTFVGSSMTTIQVVLWADVECADLHAFTPGGLRIPDEPHAYQGGNIRLSLNTPNPLTVPDTMQGNWVDFTVDIGGDAELSDLPADFNEVFDPADIYIWHQPPLDSLGEDGKAYEIDDSSQFGYDPFPNPPDVAPPATGAPVGLGIFNPFIYLDIDGHEMLDFHLNDFLYGPGQGPIGFFLSGCVHSAENLYVSFDDDPAGNWSIPFSIPVNSTSPYTSSTYGMAANRDEIVKLHLTYPGGNQTVTQTPFQSELELHPSLGPDPEILMPHFDDDVDGIDIRDGQCNVWYFTVDHEAQIGFLPGAVYMGMDGGGVLNVIDPSFHLGLPAGVDLDAIDFCWLESVELGGAPGLALLFSVDVDDPFTAPDESGGLDPRTIYFSFLNGVYQVFLLQPLTENIDALATWDAPLFSQASNCPPPTNLVIWADLFAIRLKFNALQSGNYNIYMTNVVGNIPAPPNPNWTLLNTINAPIPGPVIHNFANPGTPFARFTVTKVCP